MESLKCTDAIHLFIWPHMNREKGNKYPLCPNSPTHVSPKLYPKSLQHSPTVFALSVLCPIVKF